VDYLVTVDYLVDCGPSTVDDLVCLGQIRFVCRASGDMIAAVIQYNTQDFSVATFQLRFVSRATSIVFSRPDNDNHPIHLAAMAMGP